MVSTTRRIHNGIRNHGNKPDEQMFIEVLRLGEETRRKFLQKNQAVVIASGSWPPFKVPATQQKEDFYVLFGNNMIKFDCNGEIYF